MQFKILAAWILVSMSVLAANAQEIQPPVVEISGFKVTDAWSIKNISETAPLTILSLSAKTFTVDRDGNPTFTDIDKSKIRLQLSEGSAHLPPGASHQFAANIECLDRQPCYVAVFCAMKMGKTKDGIEVVEMLTHIIYVSKTAVKKNDVAIRFVGPASFEIENTGAGFDRPQIDLTTANGKKTFGVPVFPQSTRLVSADAPITKVSIHFSHFKATATENNAN